MISSTIRYLLACCLLLLLVACSSSENEDPLADLFDLASLDLVAISFPAEAQTLVSTDTFVDYVLQGTNSSGDEITVSKNIRWSVSAGAASTIDQAGRLNTGSVAEALTIIAEVGGLQASLNVSVSAAKFDRVVQLSDTAVSLSICSEETIRPVAKYINDDGSEEIRLLDNTTINIISWLIRNQEDDSPSQRALVVTENSVAQLQGLAAGDVFIQAQAVSKYSGSLVTSTDFSQRIDNSLKVLKLCKKSDTDLSACALSSAELTQNQVLAVMAVGQFQMTDGSTEQRNISRFSKWGTDNSSNASIAFSSDRQQIDITGVTAGTSANVSVACGDIEQTVTDDAIKNGVVLNEAVTCAAGNPDCLQADASITVNSEVSLDALSVTVNGLALVDNTTLALSSQPVTLVLKVTASYSDGSSKDVSSDTETVYSNQTPLIITGIQNAPGEYTVLTPGEAQVVISFQGLSFTAKVDIPF